MAVIKIPTSFNIDVEFEIPEFYRRLLALAIDILVKYVYLRVTLKIIQELAPDAFVNELGSVMVWIVVVFPIIIYHLALELTMNGQSVGKKILGIKVVDENGGRASFSQFFIRWLLRISDVWIILVLFVLLQGGLAGSDAETWGMVLGALAFLTTDIILVVASKKGQRIGDMLAHTILINTRTRMNIEETVFQEVADNYIPTYPQIMQLSDRDINAIKSILETARRKNDFDMATAAAEKIKGHLGIRTDLSPFDFLDILLKDYNYLSAA